MFVHSNEMQVDPEGRLHTFCHAVRGAWHMMGVNLTAGGSLQWFVESLCAELGKSGGKDPYDLLTREAARVPAGSEGLYFLPYLAGERTPHADPAARGSLIGLTLKHVRQVRASGGGARSKFWRQLQADVFGKKVVTIQAEQGPAYGVALLAAVGAGAFKNVREACGATIRMASETAAVRSSRSAYNRRFPMYQQLYQSLKGDFQRIGELED